MPPSYRRLVWAWIGTAFAPADAEGAKRQWRTVADQLRPREPKLAALMGLAAEDVLAFMAFPREHRAKIHTANLLERVNGEIKRRTDVVGISPNEAAVTRLVGAIRVNTVAHGVIRKPDTLKTTPTHQLEASIRLTPIRRIGTVEECVGAYLFLASNGDGGLHHRPGGRGERRPPDALRRRRATAVRAGIDPAGATMMDDSLEGLAYSLAEQRRTAQVLIRTAGITLG